MNAVELMMEHYHQQLQQQHQQQQHSNRQSSQTPKLTKFYSSDDSLDDDDFGPLEDEESGGNSTEVFQHFFGPNANNSNDDGGEGQQFGMQMNNKNQQTKQQNDNNKKQFTSTTTAAVPEHSKSVAATTFSSTIVSMKSLQNEWKERQISRAKLNNNSTNKLDKKMEKLSINGGDDHPKTWNGNLTENDFEKFRQIWGCNSSNVAEIALLPPTAESSTITATTSNSIPSSSISPPIEETMSMSLATNTHTTTDTAGGGSQQSIILHEQELEKLRMELELERLRGHNWKLAETNGYLLHNYALLFLMLRDADSLANGLFYKLNALKWQQQFNPMPLPPPLYFTGSPMPMLPLPPPPPPPPNAIPPIPYLPSPPHRPQPAILPPYPPPMMPLPLPMYAHPHPAAFFRPPIIPLPLPMQIPGSSFILSGGQHQHFYPGPGHAGAPQFSSSSSNESIMGGNVNVSGGSPLEIRSIHQISADPTLRASTPLEEEFPHLMATKQNCAACSPPPLPPHLVERERRILQIRPPPMDAGQNTNGNWPMHSHHQNQMMPMPRKPTNFWNPADCGLEMAITGEGQRACKQGVSYVYDFSSVRARFPIKLCGSGFYYFEVKIVVRNNRIWIGLSNRQFPLQTSLGYRLGWGYANFGCFFDCGRAKAYGEDYGTDDVIGCGLDLANGELFFTKNGTHLGIATKLSLPTTADPNELLFPTVSMCADGSTVLANFGQANFAWDINKAIMNNNNNIGPK